MLWRNFGNGIGKESLLEVIKRERKSGEGIFIVAHNFFFFSQLLANMAN